MVPGTVVLTTTPVVAVVVMPTPNGTQLKQSVEHPQPIAMKPVAGVTVVVTLVVPLVPAV